MGQARDGHASDAAGRLASFSLRDKEAVRHCGAPAIGEPGICEKVTREGKPFCPDHVDHHPYVFALLEEIVRREAEVEETERAALDAEGTGLVQPHHLPDPFGRIAGDLVRRLWEEGGTGTVDRLARYVWPMMSARALTLFAHALSNAGRVALYETSREVLGMRLIVGRPV